MGSLMTDQLYALLAFDIVLLRYLTGNFLTGQVPEWTEKINSM